MAPDDDAPYWFRSWPRPVITGFGAKLSGDAGETGRDTVPDGDQHLAPNTDTGPPEDRDADEDIGSDVRRGSDGGVREEIPDTRADGDDHADPAVQ